MATVNGKQADIDSGIVLFSWEGLDDGDVGDKAEMSSYPDRTAQAVGDATGVAIEGSNDGTNWYALSDSTGTTIALAGATNDMALLRENPRFIRPSASGGTSTDVLILAVSSKG